MPTIRNNLIEFLQSLDANLTANSRPDSSVGHSYLKSFNKYKKAAISLTYLLAFSFAPTLQSQDKQLLWGDTHLHTSLSGDAFALKNATLTPDLAYRYAKGLPVVHPYTKTREQLERPLDFLVISDHAEYMGLLERMGNQDPLLQQSEVGRRLSKLWADGEQAEVFFDIAGAMNRGEVYGELLTREIRMPVWQRIADTADAHNDPGKFTAFIGWEWSSLPSGDNLHRVVILKNNASIAKKFLPFSSITDNRPEALWAFLDETSEKTGAEFVAIPHNANISSGRMYDVNDSLGKPITAAYASKRMQWEPVSEVTQVKGDSETHPEMSPEDEFANFETFRHIMDFVGRKKVELQPGDYIRSAYKRGLEIQQKMGVNPYQFGMIGSSDIHSGLSNVDEGSFMGKYALDSTPSTKHIELTPSANGEDMSAAGMAAVWANENTRESIFNAFKRKEVYATTGPRIKLRVFAGWNFKTKDLKRLSEMGYRKGVPMGGELAPHSKKKSKKAPSFLVWAAKDSEGANLDRVQMVKGWVDAEGKSHEKVYNIAAAGNREISNNQLAAVGNTVNLKTGAYDNSIGGAELSTVWRDPDFRANQTAFYYVRVLQIPTARHSLLDAIALKKPHSNTHPKVIQERAYSSPIWINGAQ